MSILSASLTVSGPLGVVVVGSSIISPFASRPNPANNLPTSAALSVLYFKHIPESGWYVFRVRVAEGSRLGCVGAAVETAGVVAASFSLAFASAFALGFLGNEYLVVIRVEG